MNYTHHIPGRIRVRSSSVKGNRARAAALKHWLESLEPVHRVEVNPLTGSVLIHYRGAISDGASLISQMRDRTWIGQPREQPVPAGLPVSLRSRRVNALEAEVARTVLKFAAQIAIERGVLALAAAIL